MRDEKLIKEVAYEIMKAAEEHENDEPKYAIELFDSFIDCETLANAALRAVDEYKRKEGIARDRDEFTLLSVLSDIRQKTGVGDIIMLGELAEFVGRLVQTGQSAIDTNQRLVEKMKEAEAMVAELTREIDEAHIALCGCHNRKQDNSMPINRAAHAVIRANKWMDGL